MATNTKLKTHLERPELGKRGKTMCGVNAPAERILEKKPKVTCLTCAKTIVAPGSLFAKQKRARNNAELKASLEKTATTVRKLGESIDKLNKTDSKKA